MARSRDWDELQHTWVEFRRRTGQYIKDMYDQLVDLTNEAAKLNSEYICLLLKKNSNGNNNNYYYYLI